MLQEHVQSIRQQNDAFNRRDKAAWLDTLGRRTHRGPRWGDHRASHTISKRETSGAPIRFDYWALTAFRRGKQARIEWFADRAEACEAAGLSES